MKETKKKTLSLRGKKNAYDALHALRNARLEHRLRALHHFLESQPWSALPFSTRTALALVVRGQPKTVVPWTTKVLALAGNADLFFSARRVGEAFFLPVEDRRLFLYFQSISLRLKNVANIDKKKTRSVFRSR